MAGVPVRNEDHRARSYPCRPHSLIPRMEQWDAWLASDLEGAQAIVRCACAASEPALAEELVVKAGFACGIADGLTGVRARFCLNQANGTYRNYCCGSHSSIARAASVIGLTALRAHSISAWHEGTLFMN